MIGAAASILLLCALLVLRVPMMVAIASAVILNFYLSGAWALTLPQTMLSGMNRFVLIALPLFVLAGGLMNAGGISARLFEFARSLVGWLRGGLAHVNVLTSMFFGGMIGSSTADLAGTGSIVIPAMKKNGYPAELLRRPHRFVRGHRADDPAELADDPVLRRHRHVARRAVPRRSHSRESCSG